MDNLPAEKKQQTVACNVDSHCFFHLERGEVKRRRKEVVMSRLMSTSVLGAEDPDQPASLRFHAKNKTQTTWVSVM